MWYRRPALTFAIAIACSSAALASTPNGSKDVRTFVTLRVNVTDQGETVAIVRGDDVLIPIAAIEQAGVHGLKGTRERIHGEEYVSLASLAPDVTFKLDPDALSLDVNVAVRYLGKTDVTFKSNRPKNIEYTQGSSAFLNYALATASGGSDSAYFDGGINHDQDSFHASFTLQREQPFQRGLIYYQMDNRDTEIREAVGDVDASSGDLGGSMFLGGIGVARDFQLDPYAIHFPLPDLEGVATSPSVANVYVNGVLVQRIDLPPGQFNLNQLPIVTGSANAQVVVTDAFGRSATYSQNYYTSATLLTPGTTDFQYAAGLLRQNAFTVGDSYGPAAVVGRYRVGLDDSFTAGGRLEATPHLISFGPAADFSTHLGALHFALAASDDHGLGGGAGSFGYNYSAPKYGFGVSYLVQGPYYATISQSPSADRPTTSLSTFASTQMGRTTVALEYFRRKDRDLGVTNQLSLSETIPLQRNYSITITGEHDTSEKSAPVSGITAALNFTVARTNVSVTSQAGTTRDNAVEVQEAPEGKYGLGYFAIYDESFDRSLNGSFNYKSQYGNAEVDYGSASGTPFSDALRLSGAVAFIGRGVYPTSPIFGSYALIDVPGAPGVPVYLENQYVGKTNGSGKVLVPDLAPNFGNEIRIDDRDVAMNASIQSVEKMIAPPEQAGALVRFEAEYVHALSGSVVVDVKGKSIEPAYGDLTLTRGDFHADSALGANGEFYFENVPGGTYAAKVLYAGGECDFDFVSPKTDKAIVKLGQLECKVP
jgi:outer membrane usher protein